MKKITPVILLLALVAIIFGIVYFKPPLASRPLEPKLPILTSNEVSVRLPIPAADTGFAPFYLAVDNGFFEKQGVKVTIQPGSPELNPVKMVSQKADQFGLLAGPELLLSARNKNAPIIG